MNSLPSSSSPSSPIHLVAKSPDPHTYAQKLINSAALCIDIGHYDRAIVSPKKALQLLKLECSDGDIANLTRMKRNALQLRELEYLPKKKIRFEETVSVNIIESHNEYTSSECLSVWYTETEYRSFRLEKSRELLSGPRSLREEKRKRSLRLNHVRCIVLQAQSVRFLGKKQNKRVNDVKWLADFYSHHSEPCAKAARQRGIENDLDLLTFKLRDSVFLNAIETSAVEDKKQELPQYTWVRNRSQRRKA